MSQVSSAYKLIFFTNVLKILNERKMTKGELSEISGVSPSFLSDLTTTGKANPSLEIMEQIASALNVPLPALLEITDMSDASIQQLIGGGTKLPKSTPKGFQRVTATLPEHRAFLVRKWQKEASSALRKNNAKKEEKSE